MVKIRDDLPETVEGKVDIVGWSERISVTRPLKEKALLYRAAQLSVTYGEDYFTPVKESCLRQGLLTAEVLVTLEPDIATLLAAIVYFSAHHGQLRLDLIQETLGEEITTLVAGVIQIESHPFQKPLEENISTQHDNLRRMLLAVVEDVRVVLIKLAERITSLRAVAGSEASTKRQLALETRDIYAPLANRLGIGQIKWELEDFAFRYLEPEAYKQIATLLDEKRLDREKYVDAVITQLKTSLLQEKVEAEVNGRVKHIYSIWRKMMRKDLDFKDIYDVRAVRILVPEIRDCYAALGVVHSLWQHIPKEFDDYIATPKENGYRSLHTAVIGPQGRTLEIQIRTFTMHQEAELGVAAHWLYKEGGRFDSHYQRKLNALRQVLDWSEAGEGEISEILLQEILEDRVYIFTPKGEVIDLPLGATPLDFAYHIHTELGHQCRGAKVNGAIVSLNHRLTSGEQVEILSAKVGGPSRDWLNPHLGYLKSARARAKVHGWFKRQARDQNILHGKEMLEKEFKRIGIAPHTVETVLAKLNIKSLEDLYAAIGGGDLRLGHVVNALQKPQAQESLVLSTPSSQSSAVTIQGIGNLLCHFAKCCKPLPGDRILGYITASRGVTVHRQDCIHIIENPGQVDRLIQVQWGETRKNTYPVDIQIHAYDRQGLLRDITSILSIEKINVIAIHTLINKEDNIADLVLTVEIADLNGLMAILNKILQLPNVLDATRAG